MQFPRNIWKMAMFSNKYNILSTIIRYKTRFYAHEQFLEIQYIFNVLRIIFLSWTENIKVEIIEQCS